MSVQGFVSLLLTLWVVLEKSFNLKSFVFEDIRFKIEKLEVSCHCKIPEDIIEPNVFYFLFIYIFFKFLFVVDFVLH